MYLCTSRQQQPDQPSSCHLHTVIILSGSCVSTLHLQLAPLSLHFGMGYGTSIPVCRPGFDNSLHPLFPTFPPSIKYPSCLHLPTPLWSSIPTYLSFRHRTPGNLIWAFPPSFPPSLFPVARLGDYGIDGGAARPASIPMASHHRHLPNSRQPPDDSRTPRNRQTAVKP